MSDSHDRNTERPQAHPDELLAGYVDATLSADERAEVERHLAACETCRDEVGLARRAHTALARLPQLDVPMGVTRPVIDAGRRRSWSPRVGRVALAAGAAAAAAAIGLFAWVGLNNGGGNAQRAAAPAEAATGATGVAGAEASPVHVLHRNVDYDEASIRTLAAGAAGSTFGKAAAPNAPNPAASPATLSSSEAPSATARAEPLPCVERQAGAGPAMTLLQLISAKFEGQPAYIGVFAEGPRPGAPPDLVTVWVVSSTNCRLLNYTSAKIAQ